MHPQLGCKSRWRQPFRQAGRRERGEGAVRTPPGTGLPDPPGGRPSSRQRCRACSARVRVRVNSSLCTRGYWRQEDARAVQGDWKLRFPRSARTACFLLTLDSVL